MKIKALIVMTMTAAALLLPSCGKQPDKTSDANVNEPVEFGANITVSDDDDSHSQVCSYDLDGGGTEVLFKRDGYVSDVCMIGNRVFYMYSTADGKSEIRSAGVFDTSDGKDLTTEFDGDVYVSVLGHTSNGHLIHYQDSERDSFGLLSDEDFWSLKFENADFKFEQ